jgi:hypothetical protein
VQTQVERRHGDRVVEIVRHDDGERLEIRLVEHGAVVREHTGNVKLLGDLCGTIAVPTADGHELCAGMALEARQGQEGRPPTGAHDADPHLFCHRRTSCLCWARHSCRWSTARP